MFERLAFLAEDEKHQQIVLGSLKPSQKTEGFPKQLPKLGAAGMLIHRILLPWTPTNAASIVLLKS